MTPRSWTQSRNRRGATAIEFVLWLPIILTILSFMADLSWYMHQAQIVHRATIDGVRFGVRQSSSEVSAGVANGTYMKPSAASHIKNLLENTSGTLERDNPGFASVTVNARYVPKGSKVGSTAGPPPSFDRLNVTTNAEITPLFNIFPLPTTIKATYEMRVEGRT